MNWEEKLQLIIDYVEEHLQRKEEPIDPTHIAQIAECSFDFFQKMFSYMNGIGFAEYIRLRKLTLAGYDTKSTNMKIIEISFRYGYDSPTSFTKAFQQFHGCSPSQARKQDVPLQIFPKMQIITKHHYAWKLAQKPEIRCIGKSISMKNERKLMESEIPKFWNDCQRSDVYQHLVRLDNSVETGMFGMCSNFDYKKGSVTYTIMVISTQSVPDGYEEILLPAETWAIFDCVGSVPKAIQEGWRYLEQEWLIQYPFKHANCPSLEWYSDKNPFDETYQSQIWIPILEEEK